MVSSSLYIFWILLFICWEEMIDDDDDNDDALLYKGRYPFLGAKMQELEKER